jgi:hypothetical protein
VQIKFGCGLDSRIYGNSIQLTTRSYRHKQTLKPPVLFQIKSTSGCSSRDELLVQPTGSAYSINPLRPEEYRQPPSLYPISNRVELGPSGRVGDTRGISHGDQH